MFPDNQQPNQPQPPIQPLSATAPESTPISYLDQIAVPEQIKPSLFKNKIAIALIALVAVLLVVVVISSLPKKTNNSELLAAKLIAAKTISEDATSKLKSTKLRSINSNLKIYLTNTTRDLTPFLFSNKIDIKKLDKALLAKESSEELAERLLDAKLNGIYDRTYAREMAYLLSTIIATYKSVGKSAKSSSYKTFLEASIDDLTPTQKEFAEYNADNS